MSIYDPGEVGLIGTEMEPDSDANVGYVKVAGDLTHLLELRCRSRQVCADDGATKDTTPTMALIYGYMFEGHTYQMARPRIMVVGEEKSDYRPGTGGNGIDPQPTGDLYVWRMNRESATVSIAVESGSIETLILEANTPGAASKASYASHMQTAHRGGKLG